MKGLNAPARAALLATATLLVLAVVHILRANTPVLERRQAPRLQSAAQGQTATARAFNVQVSGAPRLAHRIEGPIQDGQPTALQSSGIWLLVPATVESRLSPGVVGARIVARDGRIFNA